MYSFDVFDTIITRKTVNPSGIFYIVQEKTQKLYRSGVLQNEFACSEFAKIRIGAEHLARLYAKKRDLCEVTLLYIYDVFQMMTNISEYEKKTLIDLEIETEIENVLPITETIETIKRLVAEKETVILISDMYLPADIIKTLLRRADAEFPDLETYVSSEYDAVKNNASLYKVVQKLKNVEPKQWHHVGDNRMADYMVPRLLGIDARLVKAPIMTEMEQAMLGHQDNIAENQMKIGIARYLQHEHKLNVYEMMGTDICAFILYPYVSWLLKICTVQTILELYFVSRDGYLLKKIADNMIKIGNLSIRTHYLYGSRKVWGKPEDKLLNQYLQQEMALSKDKIAFVDIQGTGKSMNNMITVLKKIKKIMPHVFYFDMVEDNRIADVKYYTFKSEIGCNYIEKLCRAPHGDVIGYSESGAKIAPVLRKQDENVWAERHLADYESGMIQMSSALAQYTKNMDDFKESIDNVTNALKYLNECTEIKNELGKFILNIPFSDTNENELKNTKDKYILRSCEYRNLIIYGVGKRGTRLQELLKNSAQYSIVAWTDTDEEKVAPNGEKILPVRQALAIGHDAVVVTIADKLNRRFVEEVLYLCGESPRQIIGYDDIVEKVSE